MADDVKSGKIHKQNRHAEACKDLNLFDPQGQQLFLDKKEYRGGETYL